MNSSININSNSLSSDIPVINPFDYLSALKIQGNLPILIAKKLSCIVQDYYSIRPQLAKKQNQMKTLYMYNQKLLGTIQNFIEHQKKITQKYNTLASMYIKSFKKYCDSKNWQVNFSNLKPIKSLFQTFSMKEWKFKIADSQSITINKNYQEMLMAIIQKYFLNARESLEKALDAAVSASTFNQHEQKIQIVQHIKTQVKQLDSMQMTTDNMFDLLQRRKEIQFSIHNLNDSHPSTFLDSEKNFIDQITRLHARLLTTNPQQLKDYLQRQKEIWQGLKKKNKECRNILDDHFEKIQTQNNELRQELDGLKKKLSDVEAERNQFRSKFQYLQLKQGSNNKRPNNSSSLFDQTKGQDTKAICSIKDINKKLQLKVAQLQKEIKHLKKELDEKDQNYRILQAKTESNMDKTQIENLNAKISMKLIQIGVECTQSLTHEQLIDILLQKISDYKLHDKKITIQDSQTIKMNQEGDSHNIKYHINQPLQRSLQNQRKPQFNIEKRMSSQQFTNSYTSDGKSYIQSKIIKEKDTAVESQLRISGSQQKNERQKEQFLVQNKILKKKSAIVFRPPAEELNSIQQRKSHEQESKVGDGSKMMRERSINQEKFILSKQEADEIRNSYRLREQNVLLNQQIINLKQLIKKLQKQLMEKDKIQKGIFETREITESNALQIESICMTLAKQLSKLEGSQFLKGYATIDEALRQIKSGVYSDGVDKQQRDHFNQIPVLSKMMHDQSDLVRSDTIINNVCGKQKEEESKVKVKKSISTQKAERLTLKSGEIQLQIKLQKSYYFGSRQSAQNKHLNYSIATKGMVAVVEQDENSPKKSACDNKEDQQDQLINIVNNFENTSRKPQKVKDQEHSLGLSQSNLKNSFTIKQSELRQLRQIRDQFRPVDLKLAQDYQLLARLEQKLSEIRNDSQNAGNLYWFYQRYKQTFAALQISEGIVRSHEKRKLACTNKLSAKDSSLSRYKLEQTIYFLQQRVNELQDLVELHKNQYQSHITQQLKDIAELRQTAIDSLVRGVLTKNYLQFSGGKPLQR